MKKTLLFIIAVLASLQLNAQKSIYLNENQKTIPSVAAGMYDRICEPWKLESGKSYLIALPAVLDGYYFGQDAQRRKVTSLEKNSDGTYVIGIADMPDLDDFMPNEAYLITPTIKIDTITHITPGLATELVETPSDKQLMHIDGDKVITGIRSVLLNDDNVQSAVYDLQGRCVNDVRKGGTYIINGKKVVVK